MSAEQSEGEEAQDLQPRPGIRAPAEPEPEPELEEPEARGRGRPRQDPQLDSMPGCEGAELRGHTLGQGVYPGGRLGSLTLLCVGWRACPWHPPATQRLLKSLRPSSKQTLSCQLRSLSSGRHSEPLVLAVVAGILVNGCHFSLLPCGQCPSVILRRLDLEDREGEETEPPRAAAPKAPTSRIPTFQSSGARLLRPVDRPPPGKPPSSQLPCPSVILRRLDLEDREGEETEPPRAAAPKAPTSRIPTFQSSGARLLRPVDRPPPGKPPSSQLPVRPWERSAKRIPEALEPGWSDIVLSPRPALRAETGTPRAEAAQEAGAEAEATSRGASKTQPRRGPPVPSEAEPREDTPPASEDGGEEVGSEAKREEVGSEAEEEEAGEEEVGSEAEREVGSEAEEEQAEQEEVDSEAGEKEAQREEAAPEAEAEREAVVFEVGARSEKPALNPRGRRAAGGREARQPGAGRPGPRGRLRRCCSALLCLLLPLLLLLGGGGLFLWPSGRPGLAGALLAPLDLDWLWAGDLWARQEACGSDCSLSLLESLPEGLEYPPGSPRLTPISQAWRDLLHRANHSVSIAAFYLTLRDTNLETSEPSALEGKRVFEALRGLPARGVGLRIAVNSPQTYPSDTDDLALAGAEVRPVRLQNLTGGILHTKLWEVDGQHAYLGSANMDWRSLTQVKELAVLVTNCSCLARDVSRLFQAYWLLGSPAGGAVPARWPRRFSALSSAQRPLQLQLNGLPAEVYLSSAPPPLSADGRTDDLSAILGVISDARRFVYVSVMDFLPASQYTEPARFWPPIDSALRAAACARGVEVRLLVSCWPHSYQPMFVFLESLSVLNHPPLSCLLHVKAFEVPSTKEQETIPYARVNHAKYMVTDRVACLARDVSRLFQAYWLLGSPAGGAVPARWPRRFSALSSAQRPLQLQLNGLPAEVYLSSAPPPLSADGRTDDLSAILGVISDARRFVYVSVMDFLPASQYTEPARFWPPIDSALRAAACARGVEVRLLVSCWPHSYQPMFVFLESLSVLNHPPLSCLLHVKAFEVPSTKEQETIPYARVNHAKYMVTDRVAYIGTSNWSENYFTHTAGVGLVVNQTGAPAGAGKRSVQSDLQAVFERDWSSGFAQPLSSEHAHRCGAREDP
ncbi:PLD3 Phospholipase, partial [Atractosteus spatula]|nr:PLD3 Phospholipase [Atractosteus spatula]